ncbi:MAG: hypothetical protein Q7S78_00025, partial [Candidatus Azambacteria bacterium]|nr:hypothetical protein [Candidatus Azambacteria bacterium]
MNKQIKIAIIIAVLVLGFGGYFVYMKYFYSQPSEISKNENTQPITENTATTTPEKIVPKENVILTGYKLYKNSEFGFEIQYPETWTVSKENIENVRGETTSAFYFSPMGGSASGGKKSENDLRFAILPRDGLSYGLP